MVPGKSHFAASIDAAEVSNETQPNSPAIGAPVISGMARTGATLSADVSGISDPDGLTGASYLYQWIRTDGTTDTGIDGATQASYVLVEADEGNAIRVRVSFSDDDGNPETLLSEATAPVRPNTPATGAPDIVGRAQVGEPLLADTSGIDDADGMTNPGFTYQWLVEDAEIPEATESGFVPAAGHEGRTLTVRVSFTDDADNPETRTSEATAAVRTANIPATGLPSIAGTPRVGEVQSADASGIADGDGMTRAILGYQWVSNGRNVPGATGSAYTLVFADEGKSVQVRVSFTDDAGNRETRTSQSVRVETQPPGQPGELAATAGDGSVALRWRAPVDAHKVSAYRILRHRPEQGEPETLVHVPFTDTGATAYTDRAVAPGVLYVYRVRASDYLGVLGPASDPASVRVPGGNAPASGAPAITGTAAVGETLTADTSGISDADGMDDATFAYQWLRNGAGIDGATGAAYTVAADDGGTGLKVRVSFTDDVGNDESLTSAAVAVPAPGLLTGAFDGSTAPASHDGRNAFEVQVYFSEEPAVGYSSLRDHAFAVQNGSVLGARRHDRDSDTPNIRWVIVVEPGGDAAVTVVLPPTTDCDDDGAVCTSGGRMLSNRSVITVPGPGQQGEDPPARPTGLSAASVSHDGVTLSWDDPGDATITGYRILRRDIVNDPPGTFSTVASDSGSPATSYTDSTVAASTRYAYRIIALNASGASPRSGYVNVTTADAP